MAKERNLPSKATLTTSDYIRVVGSDNASYKQGFSSVADLVKTVTTAIINGTDTDLNNYTTTNVYHFDTTTSTMTNAPATGTYFSGFLFVNMYQSNKVLQRFFYSGAEKSVWVRMLWSGTWSSWVKEPTRTEVDALNSNTGNIKMKRVSKQVAIADGSTSSPTTTTIDVSGDIGAGHTLVGVFATIGAYTLPYAPTSGTMQTWLYRLTASSNEIVIENTTNGWGTQTVALLLFFI